jgi:hypothetical protein
LPLKTAHINRRLQPFGKELIQDGDEAGHRGRGERVGLESVRAGPGRRTGTGSHGHGRDRVVVVVVVGIYSTTSVRTIYE